MTMAHYTTLQIEDAARAARAVSLPPRVAPFSESSRALRVRHHLSRYRHSLTVTPIALAPTAERYSSTVAGGHSRSIEMAGRISLVNARGRGPFEDYMSSLKKLNGLLAPGGP